MECPVCYNLFNAEQRRPKVMPCGHTYCLPCLQHLEANTEACISCPECAQQLPRRGELRLLPDNFMVLSVDPLQLHEEPDLIRRVPRRSRCWCVTCGVEAVPRCEQDGHHTRGLVGFRREQAARQLGALQRLEEALAAERRLQAEDLAALQRRSRQCGQLLRQVRDCLGGLRAGIDPWQEQLREAGRLLQAGRGYHQPPAPATPLPEDLHQVSQAGPGRMIAEKAALLQREVTGMKNLWGTQDPAWVLQLLQRQAATLQQLQLHCAGREQVLQLQRMPRLRALALWCGQRDLEERPVLPEQWRTPGLERLGAALPKQTLLGLLRAHRHSLRELSLQVGVPAASQWEERWPRSCWNLPGLLRGLQLRSLTLRRGFLGPRHDAGCAAQLAALRVAMPGCAVRCESCER